MAGKRRHENSPGKFQFVNWSIGVYPKLVYTKR